MKKVLFIIALLLGSQIAQAQEFSVQEIPYNTIESVYICYQADNFRLVQHQPEAALGRNYRHFPLRSDRAFITQSRLANQDPIKITYPDQNVPYYSYEFQAGQNGPLYVSIKSRAQLTESCTGRDERPNTVFTITGIPEGSTLFITYKQIESMEIPGFSPSPAERVDGSDIQLGGGRTLTPPPGGGLNLPNTPSNPIVFPLPQANPAPQQPNADEPEHEVVGSVDQPESPNHMEPSTPSLAKIPAQKTTFPGQTFEGISPNKTNNSATIEANESTEKSTGCSLQANPQNPLAIAFVSLFFSMIFAIARLRRE